MPRRLSKWFSRLDDALLVVVLVGGSWWGYQRMTDTPVTIERATQSPGEVERQRALDVLATLEVKGRAPKAGYARNAFGQGWVDVDRNGCDTRNDMLRRDLTAVVLRPNTNGCVVEAGVLDDPYTGDRIDFVKGNTTSTAVQIDHVVALSDAWQKGAQALDAATRTRFANDPLNLLAVSEAANRHKRDGDAATWLPKAKSFRCAYVARQVGVKARYRLWATAAERDAIVRVLEDCPDEPAAT